jgi:uncharacterized membrane protein YidH (DUF202 family)
MPSPSFSWLSLFLVVTGTGIVLLAYLKARESEAADPAGESRQAPSRTARYIAVSLIVIGAMALAAYVLTFALTFEF